MLAFAFLLHFRAVNNALLDTYQLKSLDAVLETPVSDINLLKDDKGRLYVRSHDVHETDGIFSEHDNSAVREPYDIVIRCLGFDFDDSLFHR